MMPFSLIAAVILDFIFGDPRWLPHPVRWIGSLIIILERLVYPKKKSPKSELYRGILLCILVIGITTGVGYAFLLVCQYISLYVYIAGQVIIAFYCLSAKSLAAEAKNIYLLLMKNDIPSARKAVSMIVGRDSDSLDEQGIARATIETVAENITDGIISPLLYLALGGPLLALAFKAVSTMDSMIGYRNPRYRYFGTCAARLDDILNFIPARITAFVILPLSALLLQKNVLTMLRIVISDRLKHPSPNSAHSEAAVAGILGIRLGGASTYKGVVSNKPVLNSDGKNAGTCNIDSTIRVLYYASGIGTAIALCIMFFIKN